MQAILELQRQLKAVQQSKGAQANKLNERNVVDIIRKLLEDNKIKLIYTQDGKEYLTNEQLEKEIKELLQESGGRLSVLEIPSHLGVNIDVVERSVDQIVKKNKLNLINGQLISEIYIDLIMEEVYEMLSDKGLLVLQELTTKYNLPLDFIKESIQHRMEYSLPQGCQLQGNSLMTKTFAERQVCKVRGILRGVTRPVALSAIATQFKVEEQKLKNITDQLIKESQIKGKIQQGLFIPQAFTQMQEGACRAFYQQNRYIEYQMLSKLQVQKPREFIEQVIGKDKGNFLANFYISKDFVQQIEGQVQEIVENGSYLDLSHIVPSPFRDQDIQDLVNIVGDQCRLLSSNQHIVSEKFIQKCLEEFKVSSEQIAIKNIKKGIKPQTEEQKKTQQVQSTNKKGKGGGGKGGKKKGRQQDDNDEEVKEITVEDQLQINITEDMIKETLSSSSNFVEFKDTPNRDDYLFDTLAEFLHIPLNKQYQMIFIEVFARQSTKQNASVNKNLEQEVEENFQTLQFMFKQLELLRKIMTQNDKEKEFDVISAPVKAHWCKTDAQVMLNKLTMVQAFYNNVDLNNLALSKDPKTQQNTVLNANDRKTVAKQFQKHVTAIFEQAGLYLSNKNFDDFMTHLSDNIKNLGARIKQTDKKIEKKIKDQLSKELKDQITVDKIESPLFDFRSLLIIILNNRLLESGVYLNLPNEEWACKIMTNLLINHGIESNMDEKKKDDLVQATQYYSLHCWTKSEDKEKITEIKEQSQNLLLELIK
ncbi:UNKNOWN [Stylonychia lemnae]|uniref:E3 UFM1-protein ligase 1-like N-terminal domain-containing protein n=1 Tax=Stylonychia lemnae TaxID=5949 RepID=A0A078B194_STYLE|nr:UNKNOWN [Stylonychia lemnae]|eukprot:CDW88324.1 UNKNOWN [Stylonychia lemnae]